MPQPRLRPRAYSCFPSASAAPDAARSSVHRTQSTGAAPSSLVDSLDLSSPLLPIEDGTPRSRLPLEAGWLLYLLSRVEEAEAGVRALRAWIVVENGSSSSGDSTSSSDGGLELEGITEDEEDVRVQPVEMEWEVVRRRGSKRAPVGRPLPVVELKSGKEALEAIGLLEHFISTSTKFLNGIKLQLTSLSPSPLSTSPFSLSPDARLQLDHFLADYHPLPSFPSLDLLPLLSRLDDGKKSAAHSATSLFNRVVEELGGLQLILTSLPSNPPLEAVREYFVEESERLSKIIHSLQSTTTSTLHSLSTLSPLSTLQSSTSTTLSHLYVEATELSSLLSHSSTAAFDEATRIYHRALEGGRKRLLRYEELPQDWKNNQHILSGYRFIGIDRWGAILRSAFEFHNETINIHSHFLGFLSLLYLLFSILPVSPAASPTSHWGDFAISLLFILAGLKCLLCSTIWHLLSGCAHTGWHRGAACVDYVGISGLIAASVMGMEYYGLYCRPELAKGYMTFTAALGVTGMIIPWVCFSPSRDRADEMCRNHGSTCASTRCGE